MTIRSNRLAQDADRADQSGRCRPSPDARSARMDRALRRFALKNRRYRVAEAVHFTTNRVRYQTRAKSVN
jgi:hypothetical protein